MISLRTLPLAAALFLAALQPASAQAPAITKISPPDWFATLPAPMLLVEGTALANATFTSTQVKVFRSQTSPNGHWAMLWLDTEHLPAETLTITVHTPTGATSFPYILALRRQPGQGAAGFSSKDVLTLIMPDRFADADPSNDRIAGSPPADRSNPHAFHGGDLPGITEHLDYVQQLGVTALWLTPILQNDPHTRDYHGYGATDMYAVEPRLGTLADYQALTAELHRRGMKLLFDDVPNHVGPGNLWVTDPPLPDWFHGTKAQHADNKYVFTPTTDPHAAPEASHDALDGWFVNTLPDLNQSNPIVAQYLTQNMIWWIEKVGIDGLRIDTFPYVGRAFWQQYLGTLTTLYPHLTAIGEVTTEDPTVNAFYAGGRTLAGADTHLTTPFDYPMWTTLLDVLTRDKPMSALEDTLRKDWLYPHPEALVPFLSNHDQKRFLSQPNSSPALLRLGFGLLMTMRGMPELYIGDEVLMTGGDDPDNRRDFPGGFPTDPMNAFLPTGRTPAQAAMHDWLAALGHLRATTPALQTGTMQTVLAGTSTFAYIRTLSPSASACTVQASMLIAINRSPAPQTLTLPTTGTALAGCRTATPRLGDDTIPHPIATTLTLQLPPNAFAIYDLQ